jgi:NodT family efflux transporter outer membrane factor (OMF) lipoprotein
MSRMARHEHVFLVAVALALAAPGCVSAPARTEAVMPVTLPDRWAAGDPAAKRSRDETVSGEPSWWTAFEDPALDSLILETLENNHDLRAAAMRIDSAAAQARIAGADLYPSVGASLNRSSRKQNFLGFPSLGGAAGGPGGSSGGGGVLSTTTTILGVSLDTAWEADLWGRIRSSQAAALADLQATQADYAAARLSLSGQISKAWFTLNEINQQVALAERTAASFRTTVAQVRERFARGLRPSLDLRLALTNLHGAESALEQRQVERAALVRQVEALAGRYPRGSLEDRTGFPPLPPPVPAGLPADLISRRPDLVAAERRLAAAGSRVAQARRALYPSLRITGSAGRQSEEFSDLLDGNFGVWNFVAALTQPLFQGGKLRAGVDLAGSREREALELYVGSALRAYSEVETALVTGVRLEDLEAILAAASEQAAAARRLAEDRYNAGLDDFLTVLEAQRRDFEAGSRLIEVRRRRLENRVDLHLALGGGFDGGRADPVGVAPDGTDPGTREIPPSVSATGGEVR